MLLGIGNSPSLLRSQPPHGGGQGTSTYTWRNGRELATVTTGGSTWTNTYDADGMRLKRTNGTNTYSMIFGLVSPIPTTILNLKNTLPIYSEM